MMKRRCEWAVRHVSQYRSFDLNRSPHTVSSIDVGVG
jgi:hypothetical protein